MKKAPCNLHLVSQGSRGRCQKEILTIEIAQNVFCIYQTEKLSEYSITYPNFFQFSNFQTFTNNFLGKLFIYFFFCGLEFVDPQLICVQNW